MDRSEPRRLAHQGTGQGNAGYHSSLPSSPAMSRNNSTLSLSSLVNSVVDTSVNLNQCLSEMELLPSSDVPFKRNSIEHTSPCEMCRNFNSTNEQPACSRCRENQSMTRSESLSGTFTGQKPRNESQNFLLLCIGNKHRKRTKVKAKDERQGLAKLVQSYREELHSLDSKSLTNTSFTGSASSLPELRVPSKAPPETSPLVFLSTERIAHYHQRQSELERAVKKLLESLTNKTDENIQEIFEHWSHLKHLSLEQFRPKVHHLQLFGQILQSSSYRKRSHEYLEANEEIQGAMHILQRVLTMFHDKHSFTTVNQLFDTVGQTMLEHLRTQLESLIASYQFELDFVRGRIHFYQSQSTGEKNFDWTQCIQVDYPLLIEKISNDFISRVPHVEQTLVQMLRDVKKRLLSSMLETVSE